VLIPIVDHAEDLPVVIDLTQEPEENEVPIPVPALAVVSGQPVRRRAGALGKSTNVKVSFLRASGLDHIKDRAVG
jgi:hypothetical protein